MQHLYHQAMKKYYGEVLKDRMPQFENVVDRMCSLALSPADTRSLMDLAAAIYRTGFEQAAAEYKKELLALGYDLSVKHVST